MAQQIHNLDDSINEYFEFVVRGHRYKFRHMNTEEVDELSKVEKSGENESKLREYLYTFIDKVDENSPDFKEVAKQMVVPQWAKFRQMIKTEFGT